MKYIIVLLLYLLANSHLCSQTFTFNRGGPTAKDYFIQLPYEMSNGRIFVYPLIGGIKHKFIIDTGSPTTLSIELAKSLHTQIVAKNLNEDANSTTDTVEVTSIDITLEDLPFKNIPAIILTPELFTCWNVEGAIGSNLFRNSIIKIDSDNHVILITDRPEKLNVNTANSISLIKDKGFQSSPLINVSFGKSRNTLLEFDMGDNAFFQMTNELMNKLSTKAVYEIMTAGYGASSLGAYGLESTDVRFRLKFPSMMIGATQFSNVIVATTSGNIASVGTKLLDYGSVVLDFINGKFFFDSKAKEYDLQEKQWSCQPTFANGKLIIGVVWDKAPKPLQPGAQILTIDGQDYSGVSLCDLINRKPLLSGKDKATLTIKNDSGKQEQIVIAKE